MSKDYPEYYALDPKFGIIDYSKDGTVGWLQIIFLLNTKHSTQK